jgi:hypothetical protein
MTQYIAFHNDPALQSKMLAAVDAHVKHDQVVQATYGTGTGEQFRGCFIGCTIHAFHGDTSDKFDNVDRVFDAYGFPPILTRLCEQIFEGLPSADAPAFFKAVPNALNIGADISLVTWKFLHWMVADTLEKYGTDEVRTGCADAVAVLRDKANGVNVTPERAATAAAADADADAAAAAAAAATAAATAAAATATATATAADAAYQRFAAKLIELIGEAK